MMVDQKQAADYFAGHPDFYWRWIDDGQVVTWNDNTTIAFRSGRTLYVNKLASACAGLDGSYALLTRSLGGELCRGDIADIADLTTRTIVGSCSLGEFVPYGPPRP